MQSLTIAAHGAMIDAIERRDVDGLAVLLRYPPDTDPRAFMPTLFEALDDMEQQQQVAAGASYATALTKDADPYDNGTVKTGADNRLMRLLLTCYPFNNYLTSIQHLLRTDQALTRARYSAIIKHEYNSLHHAAKHSYMTVLAIFADIYDSSHGMDGETSCINDVTDTFYGFGMLAFAIASFQLTSRTFIHARMYANIQTAKRQIAAAVSKKLIPDIDYRTDYLSQNATQRRSRLKREDDVRQKHRIAAMRQPIIVDPSSGRPRYYCSLTRDVSHDYCDDHRQRPVLL